MFTLMAGYGLSRDNQIGIQPFKYYTCVFCKKCPNLKPASVSAKKIKCLAAVALHVLSKWNAFLLNNPTFVFNIVNNVVNMVLNWQKHKENLRFTTAYGRAPGKWSKGQIMFDKLHLRSSDFKVLKHLVESKWAAFTQTSSTALYMLTWLSADNSTTQL